MIFNTDVVLAVFSLGRGGGWELEINGVLTPYVCGNTQK